MSTSVAPTMCIVGIPLRGALFLLFAATASQAQTPSQTVPAVLVQALYANTTPSPGTEFFVATAPPGWPPALTPDAPVAPLGGTRYGRQLVAVFIDSSGAQPLAAYERRLDAAGWSRPLLPRVSGPETGGFQGGGFQSNDGRFPYWCLDSARVSVTSRADNSTVTRLRVVYDARATGGCPPSPSPTRADAPRGPTFIVLKLPALYAPRGVPSRGGGSGHSGTTMYASTRFDSTTISPSELLAHYARQLVAAGWTTHSPAAYPGFAAQLFEARDELGRSWRGTLLVVPESVIRFVTLTMARPEDR